MTDSQIKEIEKSLPELPDEKKIRLANQYTISEYDASIITSDPDLARFL